jgi:hypothetical protein
VAIPIAWNEFPEIAFPSAENVRIGTLPLGALGAPITRGSRDDERSV